MKLAYLGYDKTILKTHTVLGQHFSQIDYYIINENLEAHNLNFFSLPIVANNVCIPTDESLYTVQHKSVLFKIKQEFNLLKKNIFSDYKLTGDEITGTKKSVKQQVNFGEIESIYFNKNTKMHELQTKNNGTLKYDYLITQGHQLVTDPIMSLKQNLISKSQIQSYLVLNLEFSVQYRFHDQHLRHDFIFIENTNYSTIFDNWYICSYSQNNLLVSLIIPSANYKSDELLNFIANRAQQVLKGALKSFEVGPLLSRWVSCIDGFVINKIKLNYTKQSAVFPSFDYWTQNKINNYIKNIFVIKLKKPQLLSAEKDI